MKAQTFFKILISGGLLMGFALSPLAADDDLEAELFGGGSSSSGDMLSEEDMFGESTDSADASADEESLFGASGGTSSGQTSGSDEDALFSGSLVSEAEETDLALDELLLVNEDGVVIGGSFSFSLTPGWNWYVDAGENEGILSYSLKSKLFFDARPSADVRIFGKADISYPFDEDADEIVELTDAYSDYAVVEGRGFDDIISIRELFSDFAIDDTVFFRVGKQTINWGVGYFFSPADLLNLSEIDPQNPEEELEGPVSVRANMPLGVDNLYGYIIMPENASDITDFAAAGKFEKVIGGTELGFGGYYRKDQAPAAMLTFSSGISDVSLFGEGMVTYGSDKTYYTLTPGSSPGLTENQNSDDEFYFSGTLGGSFFWSDSESDLGVNVTGQYYYNGEGSSRDDLLALPDSNPAKHYGAGNISLSLTDSLSTGVFWYGNLNDASGLLSPSITCSFSDYISMNLGLQYNYGEIGDEFVPDYDLFSAVNPELAAAGKESGNTAAVTLEFSLGGASF